VNLGGDIRVAGHAPTSLGWQLGVQDPVQPDAVVPLQLRDEAVVTSTRRLRRWQRAGRAFHHLIDPHTGLPATTALHTATIVAGQAWWAEVLAKVALVAPVPHALRLLDRAGVAALLADDEGRALELGDWSRRVLPS
jgi:thiamine biosynthesis lipoprotein